MPRTYTIVSIYGNTGEELNRFLLAHKDKYPTAVGFVDEAVREKIAEKEKEYYDKTKNTSVNNVVGVPSWL